MLGLTPLGAFHTAISLIAVVAGLIAFVRDKEISPKNLVGKLYVKPGNAHNFAVHWRVTFGPPRLNLFNPPR